MATDPFLAEPDGARWRDAAADERQRATIASDLALAGEERASDELRATATAAVRDTVLAIARDLIARIAAHIELPDSIDPDAACRRLDEAGLLDDAELRADVAGRVRLSLIERRLAERRPLEESAGLEARVTGSTAVFDDYVAARAAAPVDLSPGQLRRLAWRVAAALREQLSSGPFMPVERVFATAVEAYLASCGTVDAAADALAAALTPESRERGDWLEAALVDAQMPLFVALVAALLESRHEPARDLVLQSDIGVLLTALHAAGVSRAAIARIGFLLCETDPSRDVDTLPETIDAIDSMTRDVAVLRSAPFTVERDYRWALARLHDRRRRR